MHPANPHAVSRSWHAALYIFLVYVFVTGGSSQARGWTDAIAQVAALPILAVGAWRLGAMPESRVRVLGLVAIAAITLLPWSQLLPLSQGLWNMAPAREALGRDLAIVGVDGVATTWSLTPAATLRGALSLLPAVALFVAALGVDTATQRRLLMLCVALPVASLVLGFLQLGAPQDSLLNPYPEWAPSMGGIFANPNHQGTAMLIGLGICVAFAVGAFGVRNEVTGKPRNPWPATIAGGTLLLGLPLTNSRAAVVIGVLMLVIAPLAMAVSRLRRSGQGQRGVVALLFAAGLAALGLSAAMGWMRVDEIEEFRWVMRQAAAALAITHLPWGSGVGSFVPVFQQAMPESLLMANYINAAHNDYAQVWLESGVLGLLAVGLVLAALAAALRHHWMHQGGDRRLVWCGFLGMFALLAHAATDYALRTPALMAVATLLVAVLLAQCAKSRHESV
ncbi:O-antigen ligase family protein [Luteimonas sp. 8-5]|uniref:O-antigen ligase family protein n=1 Tax=Luteimonas sp. 8-5 TaxID=3039387 RepID=UPI0024371BF2|nr:O-antigen ligase family protein [Luteimonas sp. 8-5]MDG6348284.1 O-antigen ligase family protein [Luteimonas sp. 8-5]